jgi:hypothetical protein
MFDGKVAQVLGYRTPALSESRHGRTIQQLFIDTGSASGMTEPVPPVLWEMPGPVFDSLRSVPSIFRNVSIDCHRIAP